MQNENQVDQEMKVNGEAPAAEAPAAEAPAAEAPAAEAPAAEAPAAEEVKETHVFVAPRQAGKLKIKKGPSFEAKEIQKQLDGVKLWSKRVLQSQLTSEKISKEMKEAIQAELLKRK